MSALSVRIVTLEPMRVVSVRAFGESPEQAAWRDLVAWARPRGLMEDRREHRIFGFNNPDPSPGSPNYGYEYWIVIDPGMEPGEDVETRDVPGGRYAVARCRGVSSIGPTWKQLVVWCEESGHDLGRTPCLEEHLSPMQEPLEELTLDLHCPIA